MDTLRPRPLAVAALVLCLASATAYAASRPRILVTNDDGIEAPGLLALYAALAPLGEVTVAAPSENQSGVSHGITHSDPIFVREIAPLVNVPGAASPSGSAGPSDPAGPSGPARPPKPWYRISAKPATCVRLALATLLEERPDIVVSGINAGDNAGLSFHVSGTVGAAREAAFDGIPAIAVSLAASKSMDYARAADATAKIVAEVLRRGLPRGTFLSVNVPAGEIRGVKVVPHGTVPGTQTYERRQSPSGRTYYWSVWKAPVDASADTDVGALAQGFVTVTPLTIDANVPAVRDQLRGWDLAPAGAPAAPR